MNFLVTLVGWLIVAAGLLGVTRPHLMLAWVLSWPSDVRFYVIVCERILFGLFFIFAAPKSRLPQFMYAIGGITLLAGIAFIFLGSNRLETIVRWMFIQPNLFIQTMYAVAVLFGALLVFAGSRRREDG